MVGTIQIENFWSSCSALFIFNFTLNLTEPWKKWMDLNFLIFRVSQTSENTFKASINTFCIWINTTKIEARTT